MRRHLHIILATAAMMLLPFAGHAQTVTCAQNDTTCRVLHNDLSALLKAIQAGGGSNNGTAVGTTDPGTGTTTPPVVTPPVVTPPAPVGQVAALTVGPGQAIAEPADALGNMAPGGTLTVLPGTYRKTFMTGTANLTIKCQVAMKCVMDGQGGYGKGHRMTWGKSFILTVANTTIEGFKFVNCGSPESGGSYSNEAAIYIDDDGTNNAPVVTVRHNSFDNNANGIFSGNGRATVIVDEDVFGFAAPNGMNGVTNGTANGPAHDMYLAAASVEVKGSYFYGSAAHNVKTRTPKTNIHDNPVMTFDGGRVVDLSDGGALTFANNGVWFRDDSNFPARTINSSATKPGLFGNSNLLGVGTEDTNAGVPSGSLTGNTINTTRTNSTFWVNAGSLTASGNKVNLFGGGSVQIQGNLTGDISGASAPPGAPAHAPAPPLPPSAWFSP